MKAGCCTLNVLQRKANVDPGLIIGGWKAQKISQGDYLTGGIAREWGFENVEVEKGRVSILKFSPLSIFKLIPISYSRL
jgi:transcription factor C subunit 7